MICSCGMVQLKVPPGSQRLLRLGLLPIQCKLCGSLQPPSIPDTEELARALKFRLTPKNKRSKMFGLFTVRNSSMKTHLNF